MVILCSAPSCSAKKDSSKASIQFHRFPLRKPDILAKWVKAMKSPTFKPTVTSYLCSAHFSNSDYELRSTGRHLKPNAVPCYFEKKRPGRKKKNNIETSTDEIKISSEERKDEEEHLDEEEYLQVETGSTIKSNLADIIGANEKDTLQVLIVGEDGKITNSEYVFKKDIFDYDKFESKEGFQVDMKDEENENTNLEGASDKSSQTNNSQDVLLVNYAENPYSEKIMKLEDSLSLAVNKIKHLQMNYKKELKKKKQLKLLLKLLVLKRGRGEKNLNELFEEYERCEDEVKIKSEEFFAED